MSVPVRHQCRPPFLARTGSCDCSRCCAAGPHDPGCMALELTTPAGCTCPDSADYHLPYCPEYEGDAMPEEFIADEISRCHEATEFDHQCRVCTTEEDWPDEAIPGTDF